MRSLISRYTLEIDQNPNFIHACLTATNLTMDDARRYISALAAECLRLKTGKLLLERQVNVLPGRVLAYYKAATMSDMFPAGMQVAIVESDDEARERLQWGIDHSDADSINVKLFGTA